METRTTIAPETARVPEELLAALGIPYTILDRSGPSCGAGASVLVILSEKRAVTITKQVGRKWVVQ